VFPCASVTMVSLARGPPVCGNCRSHSSASAVSALREIGKLIGHYGPDRKIVVNSNINSHADLSEEEMVIEAKKIASRLKGVG